MIRDGYSDHGSCIQTTDEPFIWGTTKHVRYSTFKPACAEWLCLQLRSSNPYVEFFVDILNRCPEGVIRDIGFGSDHLVSFALHEELPCKMTSIAFIRDLLLKIKEAIPRGNYLSR